MNEYLENNQTKATVKVQMLWKAVIAKRERTAREEHRKLECAARLVQRLFRRRRKALSAGQAINYVQIAAKENVYNKDITDALVLEAEKHILGKRKLYHPSNHLDTSPTELVEEGQRRYDEFVNDAWGQRRKTARTGVSMVQVREMVNILENATLETLEVGRAPRWYLPDAEKKHRELMRQKVSASDVIEEKHEGPLEELEAALGYKFKNY